MKSTPEGHLALLFRNRRRCAARANIPFTITIDDLLPIPQNCPVLGIPLAWCANTGQRTWQDSSPSIDKINPDLGYVPGNVRIISMRANKLKSDASTEELEAILNYMKGSLYEVSDRGDG